MKIKLEGFPETEDYGSAAADLGFDPLADIPATDAQAEIALRHGRDRLTGSCMVGLFQCRRTQGATLLDAYESALLASLGE